MRWSAGGVAVLSVTFETKMMLKQVRKEHALDHMEKMAMEDVTEERYEKWLELLKEERGKK